MSDSKRGHLAITGFAALCAFVAVKSIDKDGKLIGRNEPEIGEPNLICQR